MGVRLLKLLSLPPIPPIPEKAKRSATIGVSGVTLATVLSIVQPVAEKSIVAWLTAKELNEQQTLRLENAEKRLNNLEARGMFLHGPPTLDETHSELAKK